MENLCFATASALAEDIRAGRFTAVEVLEAHLAQIARHNESLNAIVTLDEEGARRRAEAADAARQRGELWGAAAWRAGHDQGASQRRRAAPYVWRPGRSALFRCRP